MDEGELAYQATGKGPVHLRFLDSCCVVWQVHIPYRLLSPYGNGLEYLQWITMVLLMASATHRQTAHGAGAWCGCHCRAALMTFIDVAVVTACGDYEPFV